MLALIGGSGVYCKLFCFPKIAVRADEIIRDVAKPVVFQGVGKGSVMGFSGHAVGIHNATQNPEYNAFIFWQLTSSNYIGGQDHSKIVSGFQRLGGKYGVPQIVRSIRGELHT